MSIIIKKYSNRRLYNTSTSEYINLEDLYNMVKRDENFIVVDSKTEEDLTRLTLAQILFEKENKQNNILSLIFLKQLIKFHNSTIQNTLLNYLEISMNNFVKNEENMRNFTADYMKQFKSLNFIEEMTNNNLKFFQNFTQNFFKGDK